MGKRVTKIKGLIRGDISLIAKITGFSRKTIYNTLLGLQNNSRIIEVSETLVCTRREQDLESIKKLTNTQRITQRKRKKELRYGDIKQLAVEFGVSRMTIYNALRASGDNEIKQIVKQKQAAHRLKNAEKDNNLLRLLDVPVLLGYDSVGALQKQIQGNRVLVEALELLPNNGLIPAGGGVSLSAFKLLQKHL